MYMGVPILVCDLERNLVLNLILKGILDLFILKDKSQKVEKLVSPKCSDCFAHQSNYFNWDLKGVWLSNA